MSAHILRHLAFERSTITAVRMPNHGTRFVLNRKAGGEHPIPELRIFAAARCTRDKPLVKQTDPIESIPAERHVCSSADTPDRDPAAEHAVKENRIEIDWTVTAIETTEGEL